MASAVLPIPGNAGIEEDTKGTLEDGKADLKKKKLKPLERFRKFFSKKRPKSREGDINVVSFKASSTSALFHGAVNSEDDDDGGFKVRGPPILSSGSRSISEDSIFKPEQSTIKNVAPLREKTVSMEEMNKNFKPNSEAKSTSQESEKSLISVDGSENEEEDVFATNWKSSVAKVNTEKRLDSVGSQSGGEMDLDLVPVKTTESLSSNAAKHRIAVRPRDRRVSSKRSVHRKGDKGEKQTPLPSLNEESPTKSYTDETRTDKSESKNKLDNDKLVTLIQVDPNDTGTSSVHSQNSVPIEIPRAPVRQDSETSKQWTPLSTSPISMSALQDVKLRPRPVPLKLDNNENRKDSSSEDVELSKKFERVKRFSSKWENGGQPEVENVKSPSHDSMPSASLSPKDQLEEKKVFQIAVEEKKIAETVEKKEEKKEDKRTLVEHLSPLSPTSPVTFILKKEPLKPGAKLSEGRSDFHPKADSADISKSVKHVPEVSDSVKPAENEIKNSREELGFKLGEKSPSKSDGSSSNILSGSPEKLASPREEYKARRQTRSKTLPEQKVPKELLDAAKTENTHPVHAKVESTISASRQQKSVKSDYDNVVAGNAGLKPVDVKRLSWVGISGSSVDSTTEPSWVALAKKKQADNDNKPDNVEPKDAKPMPITPKPVSIVPTAPLKKDGKECQFPAEKKETSDTQTLVSGPRKDTSTVPLATLPKKDNQIFTNKPAAVETRRANVTSDSKKDINTSELVGVKVPPKGVSEKSKSLERSVNLGSSVGSSVPQWKRDLSIKKRDNGTENASQVKIEIIEKAPSKVEKKEESKTSVQIREKTQQEKFDLSSSNRKSKVLDMVKSFQKVS
ncbi:hypothetical protein ACJMK2_033010 [Sinanodonta woodiana]|uniref:Uncharacterized protein n=1 Tax=Sinanodonta woodiana TaxID=1069815 RepID=A0ABD3X505_SINWO